MARTRDDDRLVERFKAGDKAAFEQIVELYQHDVAGLVYRLLGWSQDVDDLTQDVFFSVYRHLKHFRGDASLRSWIFRIAVNHCRSARRKQWIQSRPVPGKDQIQKSAVALAQTQEQHQAVRRAIQRLPARYREPMVLVYLEELTVAETCDVLKITTNTCHVRLSRAREKLKQSLKQWSMV